MRINATHKLVKQFTFALLLILAMAVMYSLRSFIDAFLGAVMIYLLFRPLMRYLVHQRKWSRTWSAIAIILLSIMAVTLPLFFIMKLVIPRIVDFFNHPELLTQGFNYIDAKIFELTGNYIFNDANLQKLQGTVAGYATALFSETFTILSDMGIMFFILYYMLYNVGSIEKFFEQNLPLPPAEINAFGSELHSMTVSNALGAPVMATIQGIIAFIGYWICGLPDPFLWGIVTGVFSFVPIVGSALIWIPAALYMLAQGATWQPVGIIIIGVLIGVSDNVLRFALQKRFADVHPLITVLGVISGFYYFGVPGLIFGPLLISWLIILFKIFRKEYLDHAEPLDT